MEDLILLVEDDEQLGQILKDFFEDNGFSVIWTKDGESAIQLFKEMHPRLILLDVILPQKDGFEVASEIRICNSRVPIIFMTGTALDAETYIAAYRSHYATNYLEKPINPQIVLAQIKSLLSPLSMKSYDICNHTIKIDHQDLIIDSNEIRLRTKEIEVFSLLLDNLNVAIDRDEIIKTVWKNDDIRNNNILNISISRIKKNLKNVPFIKIETIYGSGYKLEISEK
jgi:Response regulators consisting of a CheY-like receiver domain and a winged-helix DNA-binding domain